MYFTANIKWVNNENGGRRTFPPKGTRYCPLIRLDDGKKSMDWSIDSICSDFKYTNKIIFKFLANNAPEDLIIVGQQYELYEGKRKVAEISILKRE